MPTEIDRPGVFRGRITEYGVRQEDSGAIGVWILARLDEIWEDGEWHDWQEYEVEAEGCLYVVKKDGSVNQTQFEALVNHAGWSGNFYDVQAGNWEPAGCQFVINRDTYKDQERFRISWINAYDSTPGGRGNVDEEGAKALDAKFGSQVRALLGNAQRNAGKPQGKPSTPKKASKPKTPKKPEGPAKKEDIPF